MIRRLSCTLLLMVSACGGGGPGPATPAPQPQPRTVTRDEAVGTCRAIFVRQRECSDAFVPALVGWRVELDVPTGIAAEDRAGGREALVAKARAEWEVDSTDEKVGATCASIVETAQPAQLDAMVAAGEPCVATTTCDELVRCLEPQQRQRLAAQGGQLSPVDELK